MIHQDRKSKAASWLGTMIQKETTESNENKRRKGQTA